MSNPTPSKNHLRYDPKLQLKKKGAQHHPNENKREKQTAESCLNIDPKNIEKKKKQVFIQQKTPPHTHTLEVPKYLEHCGILFASKADRRVCGTIFVTSCSLTFFVTLSRISSSLTFTLRSECEYNSVLVWTKEIGVSELPAPSSSGCPKRWQWAPTPNFTEGTTELWQVLSLGTQTVHTHTHRAPCQRGIHSIRLIEPFKPRQAKLMGKNIETSCGISQWQILCFGRSSDSAEKRRCTKGKLQLKLAQPLKVAEGRSNVMLPIKQPPGQHPAQHPDTGQWQTWSGAPRTNQSLELILAKLANQYKSSRCLIFETDICIWWGHAWGKAQMIQSTGVDEKESNQVLVQHFKLGTSRCHVEEHKKRVKQLW